MTVSVGTLYIDPHNLRTLMEKYIFVDYQAILVNYSTNNPKTPNFILYGRPLVDQIELLEV